MTHTNHRRGPRESLERDYVVLMMPQKGINMEGARAKLQRFFDLARARGALNLSDGKRTTVHVLGYDDLYEGTVDSAVTHAVFRDPKVLAGFLADLREANLGMSVVVSGLFDITAKCCEEVGLKPHTIEYSGGVWGRTEKLAAEPDMEVATMCGHGMIPGQLVDYLVEQVKTGRIDANEAAKRMTKLCVCGVFNPDRAAEIVSAMAAN